MSATSAQQPVDHHEDRASSCTDSDTEKRAADLTTNLEDSTVPDQQRSELSNEKPGLVLDSPAAPAAPAAAPASPRDVHGWLWVYVLFGLTSSSFLFALDNTIVANIQPAIVESLDGASKIPWVSVAFSIASSATVLTWLQLHRNFNLKYTFITGIFLFEAGSAVCGAAQSMNMLIGGRVLCGVGGVGMYTGVMSFVPRLTTINERPKYISLMGGVWGLGTVLGPVIGGAFTDSSATWRWSFYINLCLGGACAPVYIFLLPSIDPAVGQSMKQRLARLDWFGTFLIAGSLAAGTIGINCGGILYAWDSPGIIVALVLGFVGLICFWAQQKWCILTSFETRLFPMDLWDWKHPTSIFIFIAFFCSAACVTIPIYFIPLYFQYTIGASALGSAWRLLPFILLLVFSVLVVGQVLPRLGYYMPFYLLAGILNVIGASLMYTITSTTSENAIFGYLAILGLGTGLFMQTGLSILQAKNPGKAPSAVAFGTTALLNGISTALVVAQCVFYNVAILYISRVVPNEPHYRVVNAVTGADSAFVSSLPQDQQRLVIGAIVNAISKLFILLLFTGSLTTILSLLMKRERLFSQKNYVAIWREKFSRRSERHT